MVWRWAALLAWLVAPALACEPVLQAVVPLRLQEGFPLVTARIGPVPVTFLLDTGAEGDLIVPGMAAALNLPRDPKVTTQVLGTGGNRVAENVLVRSLSLEGLALPDRSTPVLPLPGVPETSPRLAGLLGAPLFRQFDVEIDAGAGRLRLFTPQGCSSVPGPALALERQADGALLLPVVANGRRLLALIDTGARSTLLTEAAAARLGIQAPVAASPAIGLDGRSVPLRFARLATVQVGPRRLQNVAVSITAVAAGSADLLLGMDQMAQGQVWISVNARQIAFSGAR